MAPQPEDCNVTDDELDRVDVRRRAVVGAAAAASAFGALGMSAAANAAMPTAVEHPDTITQHPPATEVSLHGGVSDVVSRASQIRSSQPEAAAMLNTLASQLRARPGLGRSSFSFGLVIKW
jgi:hypothetical protein